MDLLLNENMLNKESSFLLKKGHSVHSLIDNDDEYKVDESVNNNSDSFEVNDDFDDELAAEHEENALSIVVNKGSRNLMRTQSAQHWNLEDVEIQQKEMSDHLKMLKEQNSGISNNSDILFVPQQNFGPYYK